MKLIESSVQIIEEKDPYKMIELAGRTCYKSEDKITENSAKEFVDRMIKLGHGAMLEHGTIYLKIDKTEDGHLPPARLYWSDGNHKKYTRVRKHGNSIYVTTNLRVIVENNRLDDLQYQVEPTEHHEKRITVKWILDRVTGESFLRHRVFSFARESTRYCNYSKDKFNNEITFIKPTWLDIPTGNYTYWDGDWCDIDKMKIQLPSDNSITDNFLWCLNNAETQYNLCLLYTSDAADEL